MTLIAGQLNTVELSLAQAASMSRESYESPSSQRAAIPIVRASARKETKPCQVCSTAKWR